MQIDRFGTRLATDNQVAARDVEEAIGHLLSHRPGMDALLAHAVAADDNCVGAHALRGLCHVTLARTETIATARRYLASAEAALANCGGSDAEATLVKALRVAVHGGLRAAAEISETHLRDAPDAVVFAKIAHALRFMAGDTAALATGIDFSMRAVGPGAAGYGYLLGCRAFAFEERGDYKTAERLGRIAVDLCPTDAWATHAVGHVFEMTGRTAEGLAWIEDRRPFWTECNNFALHMSWHAALFHMESGRFDASLALFDKEIWPRATEDFRDLSNAISLLARLDALGVHTGDRWQALADVAEARRQDMTYCFASLHYLLALLAAGRIEKAGDLLQAMERPAMPGNDQERVMRHAARPLARLLYERANGRSRRCDPEAILSGLPSVGGSNAQRDMFLISLSGLAVDQGDLTALEGILSFRGLLKSQDRFETQLRSKLRQPATPARFIA